MKYMTVKQFIERGYLQELNRLFLHPMGLSLQVEANVSAEGVVDAGDDTQYGTFAIQDCQDDPEGVCFGDLTAREAALAQSLKNLRLSRMPDRLARLGYWIEPVASRPPFAEVVRGKARLRLPWNSELLERLQLEGCGFQIVTKGAGEIEVVAACEAMAYLDPELQLEMDKDNPPTGFAELIVEILR